MSEAVLPSPRDIFDAGLAVLNATTGDEKVELTYCYCSLFEEGLLPVWCDERGEDDHPVPVAEPAKPTDVVLVDPRKVKATQLHGAIHSIAHAERYAIDLSWDIIVRFGARPETWGLSADEVRGPDRTSEDAPAGKAKVQLLPREFFLDWLTVAKEEAKHFSKWRDRLKALGRPYGSSAGHDGLWESATKTSHSLAARLAVVHCVHEARGLDTYITSRERFVRAGDSLCVEIIDANHVEEIGHVRRGRHWLEWMCNGEDGSGKASVDPKELYRSLVRAYFCGPLRPPFNDASRDKAGLTREWWGPLVTADKDEAASGAKAAGSEDD